MKITYGTTFRLDLQRAPSHHVLSTCEAFRQLGHEVHGIYPGPAVSRDVASRSFDSEYVLSWPSESEHSRIRRAEFLWALLRHRLVRTDVIYLRLWKFRGLEQALRGFRALKVLEVNGRDDFTYPDFPALAKVVDLILVDSESQRVQLIEHAGVSPDRVRIHPNSAADEAAFAPVPQAEARAALGLPADRPVLAHVSTFWSHHDFETIERGYRLLLNEEGSCPPLLLFVGDGPQREAVERRFADLRDQGHVTFVGAVDKSQLKTYIGAADICLNLFTANKLHEGNLKGQKLYDYVACARPTIEAIDTNFPLEAWAQSLLYTVPPASPKELAEAIATILMNPEEWQERAQQGREHILRHRTWKAATQVTLQHIERALEDRAG